jgi:hypothetical protein
MAIIKCPECGHVVSDKAPFCPNCGVKIAGNPNILETQDMKEPIKPIVPPTIPNTPHQTNNNSAPKKNKSAIYVVSFFIALVVVGIGYYMYSSAQDNKENEAYEYAMTSTDPAVLQSYLDTYKDAPTAHLDSIQAHLALLQQNDQDWTNALMSNSKSSLEAYLNSHPNSQHRQEALNRIDSIDWNVAERENSIEAFETYLQEHPAGGHIDEARDNIKKAKSKDLQPQEKQMISSLFRRFFQSINSRNQDRLTDQVEDVMSSFLGKSSATKSDVVSFMNKIYKDDITNMNWHINNDYQIKKREVGDEEYEYQVNFSAREDLTRTDPSKETEGHFKINATVSPEGKISSFNMIKILE